MHLNDTDLIIQAQKGDQNAFEELVYRYDRNVLSIAMKYAIHEDDAKDLYQEVFIRVYKLNGGGSEDELNVAYGRYQH